MCRTGVIGVRGMDGPVPPRLSGTALLPGLRSRIHGYPQKTIVLDCRQSLMTEGLKAGLQRHGKTSTKKGYNRDHYFWRRSLTKKGKEKNKPGWCPLWKSYFLLHRCLYIFSARSFILTFPTWSRTFGYPYYSTLRRINFHFSFIAFQGSQGAPKEPVNIKLRVARNRMLLRSNYNKHLNKTELWFRCKTPKKGLSV